MEASEQNPAAPSVEGVASTADQPMAEEASSAEAAESTKRKRGNENDDGGEVEDKSSKRLRLREPKEEGEEEAKQKASTSTSSDTPAPGETDKGESKETSKTSQKPEQAQKGPKQGQRLHGETFVDGYVNSLFFVDCWVRASSSHNSLFRHSQSNSRRIRRIIVKNDVANNKLGTLWVQRKQSASRYWRGRTA